MTTEAMHIVQIANFVTEQSGGLRRVLCELGLRYVAQGHRCTLIVPMRSRSEVVPSFLSTNGVRVVRASGVRVPCSGGYRAIVRRRPLQRLLEELRPSVVELSDKTSLSWLPAWLRRRGVPTVLVSHERHDHLLAGSLPNCLQWRRLIARWISQVGESVEAIVCASSYSAEPFLRWTEKICIVPLGVDLALFAPRTTGHHAFGSDDEPPINLVTVGRLSPEKRPGDSIAVLSELHRRGRRVHLHIVGDGPMRDRLQRDASGLGVTFHGHIEDRAKLAELLRGADVALAPSRVETFGLSILESMASGLPVVVPDGGGACELVRPGTGAVTRSDPIAMADAVIALVEQSRGTLTQSAIRHRCRTHAEQYSWESAAEGILAVHRSALPAAAENAIQRGNDPVEFVVAKAWLGGACMDHRDAVTAAERHRCDGPRPACRVLASG